MSTATIDEQVRAAEADWLSPDAVNYPQSEPRGRLTHIVFQPHSERIERNLRTGWHGKHPTFAQMKLVREDWAECEERYQVTRVESGDLIRLCCGSDEQARQIRADLRDALDHAARRKFAEQISSIRDYMASVWGWTTPAEQEAERFE